MRNRRINGEIIKIAIYAIVIIGVIAYFVISAGAKWFGGNRMKLDTKYQFNTAILQQADGQTVYIEVDKWLDAEDGEQLTIVDKDGNVWLTSSYRCDLTTKTVEQVKAEAANNN